MKHNGHSKKSLFRASLGNEGTLIAALTDVANDVCDALSSSSRTFKLFWRSSAGIGVASVLFVVCSEQCQPCKCSH